jgi:hypothetical protein
LINALDSLDLRSNNTHPPHNTRPLPGTSMGSYIYNTVRLGL